MTIIGFRLNLRTQLVYLLHYRLLVLFFILIIKCFYLCYLLENYTYMANL